MESIAVKVLDPTGQHWAQLLDPLHTVSQLVPILVQRLTLPTELKYELVPEVTGKPLGINESLSGAGIAAGSSLVLRPVKDGLFVAFMDALYEEAIKSAAQAAWDKVKSSLETIYRLDPSYHDKESLWKQVGVQAAKGVVGGAAVGTAVSGAAVGVSAATASTSATAGATASASGGSSALGCIVVLIIGAIVCWGVLIYVGTIPAPGWLPDAFPRQAGGGSQAVPPSPDEPVLGTGDVQVTLRWNTTADIDLHVTDPSGEEIYFGNRNAASGGQLDVDANGGCSVDPTVENIFWPTGQAPGGTYQVSVDYFSECSAGPTNYEVTVTVDGRVVDRQSGMLSSSADSHTLPSFNR